MGRDNDKDNDGNSCLDVTDSADCLAGYIRPIVECSAGAIASAIHWPRRSCVDSNDTGNRQEKQEEELIRSEADLAERLAVIYREWMRLTSPDSDAIDRTITDAIKKALQTAVTFAYYKLTHDEIEAVLEQIDRESDQSVLEIMREVMKETRMRKLAEIALIAD